ncbi:hypothetical protein Tco_0492782 [Tanacetum coccineum]
MAKMEFYDTHNMVAYLKKTEGSEGFYQIVDFLNASDIRYALTENPTIYVSLIQRFWQTATASTLDNGEMKIIATIDGKVKIVTEASIRRHLKLEDYDGLSNLPTTGIFEQLALMGFGDPSKQGRKIVEINQDHDISLVQHDAEVQGRQKHDMNLTFEFTVPKKFNTVKRTIVLLSHCSTCESLKNHCKLRLFRSISRKINNEHERMPLAEIA